MYLLIVKLFAGDLSETVAGQNTPPKTFYRYSLRSESRFIECEFKMCANAEFFFFSGRVVNVSSMQSCKALERCSPELQQKFRSDAITEDELVQLMTKFVEDTKKNVHEKEGWPNTAYGVSKIGVTVLSRIQARLLNEQRKGEHILLNACCPGWVRTDMAGPKAPKSPEEGAETPVYLALLPSDVDAPHGQYVSEKTVQPW